MELAAAWEANPTLKVDGQQKRVGFAEFVAARLGSTLRAFDREDRPEVYDSEKRYIPEAAPIEITEEIAEVVAKVDDAADDADVRLANAFAQARIPVASQAPVLGLLAGVRSGDVTNGRQAAKALGIENYKVRPATAPMIAAQDLVADSDEQRLFRL